MRDGGFLRQLSKSGQDLIKLVAQGQLVKELVSQFSSLAAYSENWLKIRQTPGNSSSTIYLLCI